MARTVNTSPTRLPHCHYPSVSETSRHGLQPLPDTLPIWTPERAEPYRSRTRRPLPAAQLTAPQLDGLVRTIGNAFVQREPMTRFIQLPALPPPELDESFGPWTKENLFYWVIRLF